MAQRCLTFPGGHVPRKSVFSAILPRSSSQLTIYNLPMKLRRPASGVDSLPQNILELQSYFSDSAARRQVQAVPAGGTNVPLWILVSSAYGAHLAAEFGLPYAFASHFAPAMLLPTLQIYRSQFKPSAQLERPHAMIGVNIIAANTRAEARAGDHPADVLCRRISRVLRAQQAAD